MKERANRRGEALQEEINTLRHDLGDLRLAWDYLRDQLAARKAALDRATATLNQEGHCRRKAETLKTVVDKIVCGFEGTRLDSIEVAPADGASLLLDARQRGRG